MYMLENDRWQRRCLLFAGGIAILFFFALAYAYFRFELWTEPDESFAHIAWKIRMAAQPGYRPVRQTLNILSWFHIAAACIALRQSCDLIEDRKNLPRWQILHLILAAEFHLESIVTDTGGPGSLILTTIYMLSGLPEGLAAAREWIRDSEGR